MKLKSKRTMIAIILALIVASIAFYGIYNLFPSLGNEPMDDTQLESMITMIDGENRYVKINHPAKRVVSLASSVSEVVCALNVSDVLVGVDKYSTFPSYLADRIDSEPDFNVGSGATPSLDLIVFKNPDVVFAWPYCIIIDQIEDRGIPVFIIEYPKTVSEVIEMIKTVGLIVGKEEKAEEISDFIMEYADSVKNRTEGLEQKPFVYFEFSKPGATGSSPTITSQLITLAGGINIAENETSQYVTLNSEYIIDKNPDIIIKFYYGTEPNEEEMNTVKDEIVSRAGWNEINAVKNDKVYVIDYAESSINPRLVIGLIRYAKWIHPGLFEDLNVEEVSEYIHNSIYGLTA